MTHNIITRYNRLKREMASSRQGCESARADESSLSVCRAQADSTESQALGILNEYGKSKHRVWQEYGWSMVRVWLESNILFPRWEQNIPTLGTKYSHVGNKMGLRLVVMLLLMMIVGVSEMKATTIDFNLPNGYYYLGNEAGDNGVDAYNGNNFSANYYMCPAYSSTVNEENYLGGDSNKPLITTFKSFPSGGKTYLNHAVWYIEAVTGEGNAGYFYIKHISGQYLVANDNDSPATSRRRVNLAPIDPQNPTAKPGNDGMFKIQSDDDGVTFYISSRTKADGNNKYFSPSKGNKDQLHANSDNSNTGGIIGFWKDNTKNSAWHIVEAQCATPAITCSSGEVTITSTEDASIYYTTDGSTPTNASTAYNSADKPSIIATTTIKAIAIKANMVDSEVATTIVVPDPTIELDIPVGGYTYDGTDKEPTVTVKDGETTIDEDEYNVDYSNNTDAGTDATVTITDKEGGVYYISGSTTFTIAKADLTAAVTIEDWAYNGSASTPSVTGNSGNGAVTYQYKVSGANDDTYTGTVPTAIGSYIVRATIAETANYNGATVTAPFAITKIPISPSVSIDGWTYGETANTPVVTGNTDNGEETIEYKVSGADDNTYTTTVPTDAGNYTVRVTIAETTNYSGAIVTADFIIAKIPISPSVSIVGWTYGESANTPSVTGNTDNGEVTYEYKVSGADDNTYTTTVPTDAGSYTVRATIEETTNYSGATATDNFTIAKATFTSVVIITGWTYGGTASTPFVIGNTSGGTVTYSYKVKDADDATYSVTVPTNAGNYTLKATIAETPNYNSSTTTAVDFTIAKATFTPTVSIEDWTYGEAANLPSVSDNTSNGDVSYSYKVKDAADNTYDATVPTAAGDYTVMATIAATSNYNSVAATTNFTISPKTIGDGLRPATGITITPGVSDITVVDGGSTLTENTDYTKSGASDVKTITGINNYTGSAKVVCSNAAFERPGTSGDYAVAYVSGLDIMPPTGVTAYVVQKISPSIGKATITPICYIPEGESEYVGYIPEGVPVILMASTDSYSSGFAASPIAESTPPLSDAILSSISRNLLQVAPDKPSDPANLSSAHGVAVKDAQAYVYYKGEFVLTLEGTISPGKIFLYNPNYTPAGGGAGVKILRFVVEDEDPDRINEELRVKSEEFAIAKNWYTLDGRRIDNSKLPKGIYITNGRKVIIK